MTTHRIAIAGVGNAADTHARAAAIVEAIYESAETGRPVTIE